MPKTRDLVDQGVTPGEQSLYPTVFLILLTSRVGENTRRRGTGFLPFASHYPVLFCALVIQVRGGNLV